jgi:hypothetical protein
MCTILSKSQFIGKNYDSAAGTGMMFTNKKGLIKQAAVFPPGRPVEWVSAYGSITFSQSGKEYPVGGINEAGLVVEQATLPEAGYPEHQGKPLASSLETTQYLLDTCRSVDQALDALERFSITKTSWPVHYALFDSSGAAAVVEYLAGKKQVYRGEADGSLLLTNTGYREEKPQIECHSSEEMFTVLEEYRRPDTVWSNVYDTGERKLYLKRRADTATVVIDLDSFDFSPGSRNRMLDINGEDTEFLPYRQDANRELIGAFFRHPVISGIIGLQDPEVMIGFIADQPKNYDRDNEIVLRFLEGEQIRQLPVKGAHKLLVLKYLASKFEIGKEYTEGQVNAMIDGWHTFGDYFILRRELVDSGLLKRLPNGSKYWREME